MNLWRVAIDERTGKALGEPEPVTTPSNWSGMMSFARDGLTMAFASLDWRSTLLRQSFDPAKEVTVGPPSPLLRGSRPIRDHDISPDGQWIVFNETGVREDLFVARIDGSEYRRLTDDAARDRGPAWTRDGQRIVFYSDRSGSYDLWSVRPDGSHLEQLTSGSNGNFPIMSPDGTRIAFSGTSAKGLFIIPAAPGAPPVKDLSTEPPMGDGLIFWPASWSSAGELIGFGNSAQGRTAGYSIYDTNARTYRPVAGIAEPAFSWQVWLKDGRRFLARTTEGISVYSTAGTRKLLTPVRGYAIGRSLAVASDNTWYSYTETGTEGDIWLAVLKGK
jgi:dipeptidyl aminopeptidase/acylaminoacyl peptidase